MRVVDHDGQAEGVGDGCNAAGHGLQSGGVLNGRVKVKAACECRADRRNQVIDVHPAGQVRCNLGGPVRRL